LACDGMAFERIDGRIPYGVVRACVIMIMTAAYRGASTGEHQEGKTNDVVHAHVGPECWIMWGSLIRTKKPHDHDLEIRRC
jgi:hypothetical protein